MQFTNIIFDFDGTIVDSMPIWIKKVTRILENEGVEYDAELIKTITPLGDIGTANYFKDTLGIKASVEEIISEMDNYAFPEYKNRISLKQGVLEYLVYLKRQGYSLHILSASPREMIVPCLKRNGIYNLFDNVWSCMELGKTKSDPCIYIEVASRLKHNPCEIVFFDDNVEAIRAAARSGMRTVGVYDKSAEPFRQEIMQISDMYICSFLTLRDIVCQKNLSNCLTKS